MSLLRTVTRVSWFRSFVTQNSLISSRHYAKCKEVTLSLIEFNGVKHEITDEADNECTFYDVVHDNIDMPSFGVCGGSPGCTTCHIIFHPEDYKKISTPPGEIEQELLKTTPEAGPTSRLGCQVVLEEFMDGIEIRLPSKTTDMRNFMDW